MEPTSHQPANNAAGSATPSHGTMAHSTNTSPVDPHFSTTAAHATGDNPTPVGKSAQPAGGVKEKLDNAVTSGKKWLDDSGLAEQAQQLPQKAKDLSSKAWASVSGLSTTQKAVGVGLLAAGVAFLATRGKKGKKNKKSKNGEHGRRGKVRSSIFDHQPHTIEGNERMGQRPWGSSRYGSASAPAGRERVSSGSGYTSSPASPGTGYGHPAPDRRADMGSTSPNAGQRRDQGPASGNRYDANTSGGQNPNNLDQLNSAF